MKKQLPQFIFLHIRKTGGQTLKRILTRHYPLESIFVTHNGEEKFLNALKNLPAQEKETIQCVFGHMPFGLHSCFTARMPYVTLLRDPVERILSTYFFAKENIFRLPDEHRKIQNYTLKEFVSLDIPQTSNYQTGVLCGAVQRVDALFDVGARLPANALSAAKENIKNFFMFVGVTERFDESLLVLRAICGWKDIRYYKRNTTTNRPAANEISKDILDSIRKKNDLDIELYSFANSLLDEKIREYPGSFLFDMALFKASNWLYQKKYAYGKVARCV